MQNQQPKDLPRHEGVIRHPVHLTVEQVAQATQIADEGASPAALALVAGTVVAFVLPFAAMIILTAFVVAHFA